MRLRIQSAKKSVWEAVKAESQAGEFPMPSDVCGLRLEDITDPPATESPEASGTGDGCGGAEASPADDLPMPEAAQQREVWGSARALEEQGGPRDVHRGSFPTAFRDCPGYPSTAIQHSPTADGYSNRCQSPSNRRRFLCNRRGLLSDRGRLGFNGRAVCDGRQESVSSSITSKRGCSIKRRRGASPPPPSPFWGFIHVAYPKVWYRMSNPL